MANNFFEEVKVPRPDLSVAEWSEPARVTHGAVVAGLAGGID